MFNWQNGYTPWYQQQPVAAPQQPQVNNTGIIWVQGEAGAKSYAVAPGQSAIIMDSEEPVFYIKTVDASGMPLPLRTFAYEEKKVQKMDQAQPGNFVTHEELEKRLAEIVNAQPTIPAA